MTAVEDPASRDAPGTLDRPAQNVSGLPAPRARRPAVTVIVPTRNERDNVAPLVDALERELLGADAAVLFVDDSTDDTPVAVQAAAARSRLPVRLLHREPHERAGGLGGAVVDGMSLATTPYVVVMDGDLQHPAGTVPRLLDAAVAEAADVVVASRYTGAGEASGLGSTLRLTASGVATVLTRLLFPRRMRAVSDPMSGFFAVRLAAVDLRRLQPRGFKILLELLLSGRPLRVTEVPFAFGQRVAGTSKASAVEAWRLGRLLLRLRLLTLMRPRIRAMLGFGLVGLSGIGVNTAAFLACTGAHVHYLAAAVVATQVSTVWNFVLTDRLVFAGPKRYGVWRRFPPFAAVNELALLGRLPLLALLVHFAHMGQALANLLTILLVFLARFLVSERLFTRLES